MLDYALVVLIAAVVAFLLSGPPEQDEDAVPARSDVAVSEETQAAAAPTAAVKPSAHPTAYKATAVVRKSPPH